MDIFILATAFTFSGLIAFFAYGVHIERGDSKIKALLRATFWFPLLGWWAIVELAYTARPIARAMALLIRRPHSGSPRPTPTPRVVTTSRRPVTPSPPPQQRVRTPLRH